MSCLYPVSACKYINNVIKYFHHLAEMVLRPKSYMNILCQNSFSQNWKILKQKIFSFLLFCGH